MLALDIAYTIYMKFEDLANALRIALLLDSKVIRRLSHVILLFFRVTFELTCISMFLVHTVCEAGLHSN
jgi:hypothetical protein